MWSKIAKLQQRKYMLGCLYTLENNTCMHMRIKESPERIMKPYYILQIVRGGKVSSFRRSVSNPEISPVK